ncbi:hypothetical protein HAD_08145 [Hyphomonas adhaerens MHS-3]|uniref:N-acetyltransferase domain-containing protein n=1 Tax=Hyphomonas adhaerens MHS-3 TaxID=1280949 RepID=A0A069E5S9_9PROT|nr:GNAT family protein [Hyphomonas adhaerens]KCZ85640.1 hypothetical protein HAD_08145 [Hyphomonas adhaerens MHS-3]
MDVRADELSDRYVTLVPFDVARDGDDLRAMADALGPRIETWPYYNPPSDWVGAWLANIEARTAEGTLIPFRISRPDGQFAGLSTYINPDALSRNVEIGMTMYTADAQGTEVNAATKRLLLAHAFACGAVRVQFNVDQRNKRSQAAVKKLGGVQEGILRDNRILPNGVLRSTVVFSILASEWPAVKAGLDARLAAFE